MTTTPAGWYDDGQTPGHERYWDGAQWTQQFRPLAPAVPVPASPMLAPVAPPAPGYAPAPAYAQLGSAPGPKRKVSIWAWLAPLIVVLLAGIGVGVWLLVSALGSAVAGPSDATKEFTRAWNAGDCAGVRAVVTEDYALGVDRDGSEELLCQTVQDDLTHGTTYTSTVRSVSITNDTSVVLAQEQWTDWDGVKYDELIEYGLVKVDGKWLIDSYDAADGEYTPIGSPTAAASNDLDRSEPDPMLRA